MIVAEQGMFDLDVQEQDIEARYLALAERKHELEEVLESVKKEMQSLEPGLLTYWLDREKSRETRGGRTIYLHRGRFAVPLVDDERVCAALMDTELRDLVKYGVNKISLTARLKEAEQQGGIPQALDGVVELGTRYSVRYRRG